MCGIFGFTTTGTQPVEVVIGGLLELEYRGYDSWGVAVAVDGSVVTEKQTGKIGRAKCSLPASRVGLGHTRWATHGAVTHRNAHPHVDCSGRLAVIHNGIVENHDQLRPGLSAHQFQSDTDTEVIVHLLEDELSRANGDGTLVAALMTTFDRLEGLSAIAAVDGKTGELAAVKNGSPLVVGVTDDGPYLASDPVALLPLTNRLIFIEDGQAVTLDETGVSVFDVATRREIEPEVKVVNWQIHVHDLAAYDHFMRKEIDEQPRILRHLAATKWESVERVVDVLRSAANLYVTGCGTAHNAGAAGQYLFSRVAHRRMTPIMASEMTVLEGVLGPDDVLLALSQSGETIDVLDAARVARAAGARVVALTNSEGSSLFRFADLPVLLEAGPERCVLATKTYTAKLAVLMMAAFGLAGRSEAGRGLVSEGARLMEAQIVDEEELGRIAEVARRLSQASNIFVLGRQVNYPLAMEAALKIKEVSYVHAEGFASGELKHGVIALIEPGTPCLILATEPTVLKETLSGASEVRARGAFTVGISQDPHPEFDIHLPVRGTDESVIFEVACMFQLLAYHMALTLGRDPDKPRNLAKSVTVR